MHTQQDVMVAVSQTLNLNGIRIWGGHVLVSSGTVTFNGCIFYDLEIVGGCGRWAFVWIHVGKGPLPFANPAGLHPPNTHPCHDS